LKYQGTDNICVCFIGDGAMNSGAFHESLNMAALYKLPVLFLLENNHYAMGTSVERSHANTDLASRADSYGIPHSKVDGQDYFAMRAECEEVVSKMRTDSSPYFLEAVTYRYVGHGAADDSKTQATYRDHSEVDEWKLRDPVAIFSNALKTRGIISDEEFDRMDHSAVEAGRRAAEFAEESRTCSPEELTEDVYV
jgi:pyruvate dehydrogenase E1 component alpha subunit